MSVVWHVGGGLMMWACSVLDTEESSDRFENDFLFSFHVQGHLKGKRVTVAYEDFSKLA